MTNSSVNGSRMTELDMAALRERLAELEHEQWCAWSRSLAETERLSAERSEAWRRRWRPYSELPEHDKDLDREYADRVIELLRRSAILPAEAGSND